MNACRVSARSMTMCNTLPQIPTTRAQFPSTSSRLSSNVGILTMSFRVTPRLLATATELGTTKGFRPAPMALLPPIPLYRRLLRAHRKHLPREMRLLGDEYIKSEFRAHREVENPVHIVGFTPGQSFRSVSREGVSGWDGWMVGWGLG